MSYYFWEYLRNGLVFGLFGIAVIVLAKTLPLYNTSLSHEANSINNRTMMAEITAPSEEMITPEAQTEAKVKSEPRMNASQVYFDVMSYRGTASIKIADTLLNPDDIKQIQNGLNERGYTQKLNLALNASDKNTLYTKEIKDGMIVYTRG